MARARATGPGHEDSPRTRKSSLTLAAFRPWGSWARYRHAGNHRRVYGMLRSNQESGNRAPRKFSGRRGGYPAWEREEDPMAESRVSDELWNEFHELVNMTSRELEDWLRTDSAGETTEPTPD